MRDNIHSADLVARLRARSTRAPRRPRSTTSAAAASRNCSMLEAIELCERIAGRELDWTLGDEPRIGDHRWWITDLGAFAARLSRLEADPAASRTILREIHDANAERWVSAPA